MATIHSSIPPVDTKRALLVGRVWREGIGSTVVAMRDGEVFDTTRRVLTVAELFEYDGLPAIVRSAQGMQDVAALVLFLASDNARRSSGRGYFVDAGWYGV